MLSTRENWIDRIARIGHRLLTGLFQFLIHLFKRSKGHIDLAPDRMLSPKRRRARMHRETGKDIALIAAATRDIDRLSVLRIHDNAAAIQFGLNDGRLELIKVLDELIRLEFVNLP